RNRQRARVARRPCTVAAHRLPHNRRLANPSMDPPMLRRMIAAAALTALAATAQAQAPARLVFSTDWLAQAEHVGFYQAVAEGIYRRHGLDVEVKMGGPQVNVVQLLVGGQADLVMGYD